MSGTKEPQRLIPFGPFEVDLTSQELRKQSIRLRLPRQSFQILKMLLERPGTLVTREELRAALWPSDTFVDFEHGLNAAVNKLRETLGDDADDPRYIETLPKRGYRFMATMVVDTRHSPLAPAVTSASDSNKNLPQPVTPLSSVQMGASTTSAEVQVAAGLFARHKRVSLSVVAAAILILAGLGSGAYRWLSHGSGSTVDSLAVLPFTNGGGDANTDYLSDGITESLIDNLAHVPQLKVKSRNSIFHYKGKDVDVQKLGKDLGVSALVTGRVVPRGDSIEVSTELTDVRDNTVIWGQHYSGKSADIISLQELIAGDLAGKLRSRLSKSEKRQVTKQGTQNPEAYELYLKGRYAWNKRTGPDLERAIAYFNQAITKDPSYALAYSGVADVYNVLPSYGGNPNETFRKSNVAARKALELDATLAHPHAVLGSNEMEYDWDFAGGEAEYKQAFELDPNDATAHLWHAQDIGLIGGREQEALAEVNHAHQLELLSPIISGAVGFVDISARRYDEAIVICKKVTTDDSTFAPVHSWLARAYWGKHMYTQVIEEWKTFGQLGGDLNEADFASAVEQGFHTAGWKGALTKGIEIRQAQRNIGYYSAYRLAELYADLGDKDQAFGWLNTAYLEHDLWLIGLKTDFTFEPLRSDPRFAELVHKVGLPQ